jgi:O-acetylhomoserine (thiol)-lyase
MTARNVDLFFLLLFFPGEQFDDAQRDLPASGDAFDNGGGAGDAIPGGENIIFQVISLLMDVQITVFIGPDFIGRISFLADGGTFTQFSSILPQYGITAKFTAVNDFAAVEAAINDKTRAIYIETVGNPVLDVADIEGYSRIAKKYHLPLIVDATFTPPTLLRPIEHGANIVIHSLSKWIGGHGTGIGGIVIDAGNFDWSDPKFSLYNEPDGGYHGLRFAHDLGGLNHLAFILRLRTVGLRNVGPTLAPDAAWIFIQGVETLPLRIRKHSENTLAVARFLQKHPAVAWVRYPGLESDPGYPLARKYLKEGFGGVVVFGIKGGSANAVKVINNIALFSHLANVGDAKSLILHPSSTSHSQMSDDEQRAAGLHPELLRLSVGLEHIDDITEALDAALKLTL